MKIVGKKLIVLGGVAMICELVENVKMRGGYVIVADYYPDSPAKKIADEAWLISTADTETLAKMCREKNVDGVIAAFDDFNVLCAQKLSEKIGRPFYARDSQIEITMNKARFKELCRESGVPSTPEYDVDEATWNCGMRKMEFPVIVKPVDGSGSRGIMICYSHEELREAYKKAKEMSKIGKVIIEKYLIGDEIGVNYVLQKGNIYASILHDRYMQAENGRNVRLPLAYVYPSKYTQRYLRYEDQKVIDMFRSIGMENGTLFLQGCMDHDLCLFYEMGYRLNGAKQYQILDKLCGFNPMEMIVNYSLTGEMEDKDIRNLINPRLSKVCCTLSILVKPSYIDKIIGLDVVKDFEETIDITMWCKEGEYIKEDAWGTQKQIAVRITLIVDNKEKLPQAIGRVYDNLEILDEKGESIIIERFDPARLFDK